MMLFSFMGGVSFGGRLRARGSGCGFPKATPPSLRLHTFRAYLASCSLLTCMVVCFVQFSRKGALVNTRWAVGLYAIALVTIPVFPNSSGAQGTLLNDKLLGKWIYSSSTAKRDSGNNVPRSSYQCAIT